jgi:hypothetical protein
MIYLVALVVLVLATARLTRLVTKDDITAPMRLAIDKKLGEHSLISRLIWCPWCVAVWVSIFTSFWAAQILYSTGTVPRDVAIMLWLMFIPANAYAAAWVVDKEGE